MDSANPREALWNRWDPHIHAPGTILSDQYKGSDPWEEFLSRIEKSDPTITALGITDYYSIAVYEQVLEKQRGGRLSDVGLIFPNVEMRFGIETAKGSAINVHLLFSPERPEHVALIKRFLSELHFPFEGETCRCDPGDLVRLGKAYDKSIKDEGKALETGSTQFKVNFDELRKAWKDSTWVQNNTLVAVAGGSADGTAGLKENSSLTALRREIERFANIIFSSHSQHQFRYNGLGCSNHEPFSFLGAFGRRIPPNRSANNMGVNIKRERSLAMPYLLLAQLQRRSETVHQRNVCVAESMQPTAFDTKRIEQWIRLPFHHEILIPRRSQSRGEEPTALVRLPLRNIP
jgi:hypothetical protein